MLPVKHREFSFQKIAIYFVFSVVFFQVIPSFAWPLQCSHFFKEIELNSKQIDDAIFKKLIEQMPVPGFEGSNFTIPVYFGRRDQFPIKPNQLLNQDPNFRRDLQLIYSHLNNPAAFSYYIGKIILEIKKSIPSDTVHAVDLGKYVLAEMKKQLLEEGFTFESVSEILAREVFLAHLKEGHILLEGDQLSYNTHGRDSHIIQLAYITYMTKVVYGSGKFLNIYKLLGTEGVAWELIFDHTNSDHLGNPSIIHQILSGVLFTQ